MKEAQARQFQEHRFTATNAATPPPVNAIAGELNPQTIKRWLDGKTSMSLVNYEKIHNLMEGNE